MDPFPLSEELLDKISISDCWKRLILFVQREVGNGDIEVRIVNSEPTELISARRKVRFDKPGSIDFPIPIRNVSFAKRT